MSITTEKNMFNLKKLKLGVLKLSFYIVTSTETCCLVTWSQSKP